jgi:hypothetical protein
VVFGIATLAWITSILKLPKLLRLDLVLIGLVFYLVVSWFTAESYGRSFIPSQISSYFVLLFAARFLLSYRNFVIETVISFPFFAIILASLFYIIAQYRVGYEYELGGFEALMLLKLILDRRSRIVVLPLLLIHLAIMFMISTRSTPAIAAFIILVGIIPYGARTLRLGTIVIFVTTPFLGWILEADDTLREFFLLDDNAEIRSEMIKGANHLISNFNFATGIGFGRPFRSTEYDYDLDHPLLYSDYMIFQISNHNSLFDIFLRTGLVGYLVFLIYIFRVHIQLKTTTTNAFTGISLAIAAFSMVVNAYLDSTKLTLALAIFLFSSSIFTQQQKLVK